MFSKAPPGAPVPADGSTIDAAIHAAVKLAFPGAAHRAVSEWQSCDSGRTEFCVWTHDGSGGKWTVRLRAGSQRELLFLLESQRPATSLRLVGNEENRSKFAAQKPARKAKGRKTAGNAR